jgi:hypothetical protein
MDPWEWPTENGYEILNVEHQEYMRGRFTENVSKQLNKVQLKSSGSTRGQMGQGWQ